MNIKDICRVPNFLSSRIIFFISILVLHNKENSKIYYIKRFFLLLIQEECRKNNGFNKLFVKMNSINLLYNVHLQEIINFRKRQMVAEFLKR